jgi:hypothetical protein
MPRRWFDEIGGFDERIPAWEDCLLMWELAWSGRCFSRIPQPLMTYRFAHGKRRERGLQEWDNLVKYISVLREKKYV